jgi:hypothetical protein
MTLESYGVHRRKLPGYRNQLIAAGLLEHIEGHEYRFPWMAAKGKNNEGWQNRKGGASMGPLRIYHTLGRFRLVSKSMRADKERHLKTLSAPGEKTVRTLATKGDVCRTIPSDTCGRQRSGKIVHCKR